jgi:hypothetical protein
LAQLATSRSEQGNAIRSVRNKTRTKKPAKRAMASPHHALIETSSIEHAGPSNPLL